MLPLLQQSAALILNTLVQKNAKKEVVLVEFLCIFSGKTNHTFRPPKGLKLQERKKNMLSTCDK